MSEIIIRLEGVHPLDFFGPDNRTLINLRRQFPGIKLTARGSEIKAQGESQELQEFQDAVLRMIQYFDNYGEIPESTPVAKTMNEFESATSLSTNSGATGDVLVHGNNGIVVKARTANQRELVKATERNDIVFAVGPAGTGKSYTAVALAIRALKQKAVRKIILTRPAVEAGENLGFLPGDLKEKIDPYLRPLYDALNDMIPPLKLQNYLETDIIEIAPLAFMRGRTLDNAFVILDEAQNTTESQIKMFLTRMGPSAKFIITGDLTQIDLPRNQRSGLVQSLKLLRDVKGIQIVQLTTEDVVRHRLVKDIIRAYHNDAEVLPNDGSSQGQMPNEGGHNLSE